MKSKVLGLLAAGLLAGPMAANALPISVGVIAANSGTDTSAQIASQLNNDTFFDFSASVITSAQADTLAELSAFDVVMLGGSGNSTLEYPSATLAAVRAFLQAGGGVVTTGWYRFGVISTSGQGALDADAITPIVTGGAYDFTNTQTLDITNSLHPITIGVADIPVSGCCIEVANAVDGGATVLGNSTGTSLVQGQSNPPALVYQDITGRSVYIGLLYSANAGYGNAGLRSGDADRLLEQAVAWSAGANAVPEPATIALLAVGLAGLGFSRRK